MAKSFDFRREKQYEKVVSINKINFTVTTLMFCLQPVQNNTDQATIT